MYRLTEEKETAEFQFQEASLQLAEVQEELTAVKTKQAALEIDAESNNTYQQELEGTLSQFIKSPCMMRFLQSICETPLK